jgi:hypothetical protein
VNGFRHCYKRHGATTLFAALDVATGQVTTGHYARRSRREFLDFMNDVVAENAGKQIHMECWFSILSRSALRGGSFTSARQLREAIDAFVNVYNEKATPFERTKAVVRPSSPKRLYSDLCK